MLYAVGNSRLVSFDESLSCACFELISTLDMFSERVEMLYWNWSIITKLLFAVKNEIEEAEEQPDDMDSCK